MEPDTNLEMDARLFGHSRSAHKLFGFCASCPDRTMREEVVAWRAWAVVKLAAERDEPAR